MWLAAGMAAELDRRGFSQVFDEAWGTSSGAFVAAAFVGGYAAMADDMFCLDLTDRRFIDRRRLLRGQPALSLDFLIEEVAGRHGVDWARIVRAAAPVHPIAFSLDRFATVDLGPATSADDLAQRLRASACMPVVAGPPVVIDGERYLDGSILDPIPYRCAIEAGATHVLILATRPEGVRRGPPSLAERAIVHRLLRHLDARLPHLERARSDRYNATLDELDRLSRDTQAAPHVFVARSPAGTPLIGQTEQDATKLRSAADTASDAIGLALESR